MNITQILLCISMLLGACLVKYTSKYRKSSKVYKYTFMFSLFIEIHIICMLIQSIFASILNIAPIYFEYFTGLVAVYTPVILVMLALTYSNEKVDTTKYRWLYIFPSVALIGLWTNDLHHLFYISYSTMFVESINGILFTVNALYSYTLIGVTAIILLKKSYMKSGFCSIQTVTLIIGISVPIVVNILGAFKIIPMTVYVTPILFSVTASCFALAIIKFKALNIIPVAMKTVMNTMSDSFIVISEDGTIVEYNKTFEDVVGKLININKNDNFFEVIKNTACFDYEKICNSINSCREQKNKITIEGHIKTNQDNKYFDIDIQSIKTRTGEENVATLLLFKDITEHELDKEKIRKNTDVMAKQAQLATLGELARWSSTRY